jgi:hypothetical protein
MPSLEIIGIYALLTLNIGFTILLAREGALKVLEAVQELDSNLATALQGLGDAGPMSLEGVNPIQMAIAQWIGATATARANTIDATVTQKTGADGRFVKKILEDS